MREVVCRPYVLRMVKEALRAQTTASESLRPSKRRKPNPHSADVLSSLASPQRKSRSQTPSTPKGRPNHDIGSSDDDIKQEEFSGSEHSNIECPVCAKSVPMTRINDHLDSGCKSYSLSGKTASSSRSEQKDAWSKLLDGKSGKEK
jgi:E3 ubiquitin-protein ligase RAD18